MSPIQTFYTVPAGSPVKSVQRGSAVAAGTVTITSVDISKAFVNVFGTSSSGTVAASGSINASSGNISASNGTASIANIQRFTYYNSTGFQQSSGDPASTVARLNAQNIALNAQTFSGNSTNITGGSTNLVAAVVQGYLSNSTSLVVSGPCRWEVVEFN